jgi:hypothetical protein
MSNVTAMHEAKNSIDVSIMVLRWSCPEDSWNIGLIFWSRNWYLVPILIGYSPSGRPKDKLVSTFGNWKSYKVTEENPEVFAVMLPDLVQGVFVGC